ncbi:TIGR03986 family type III CRISPR-associated RAMP protein [Streptomyces sp. NPDC004838]
MADRSGRLQREPDMDRLVVLGDDGDRPRRVKRERMLVPELRSRDDSALDGLEVDYDWIKGQPANIRTRGAPAPERPVPGQQVGTTEFANPYLFIAAPPREGKGGGLGDLGDRRPDGHHRIRQDRWSGRIAVTLTVETPLLLLDTSRPDTAENGHVTYPVPTRAGAPHLPATSVKGMLRTAYEAVTNSRFGVFTGHDDRLGYRMTTREGLTMVPARISDDGEEVVLLPGDTPVGGQGDTDFPLHAAWLPQYTARRATPGNYRDRRRYPDGRPPAHGDEVDAEVELCRHPRKGFLYWTVRRLSPADPAATMPSLAGGAAPVPGTRRTIRGWVFISNQNVGNKHDERVFFAGSRPAIRRPLTSSLRSEWQNLIRDYRAANRRSDVLERRLPGGATASPQQFLGDQPGKTAWSPHQYENTYLRLEPGTLCYATVVGDADVTGLYPVAIARALFDKPPKELLHSSLRPAADLHELSPADRVFGWVADSGGGAYRGQLRVGPVTCDTAAEQAVETFPAPGVPLAVLSAPKPQQGRFYLAADQNTPHKPLRPGKPKNEWFTSGQGPRGRKAYWHHAGLPGDYWSNPAEDRTQTPTFGRYQEYRRPGPVQHPASPWKRAEDGDRKYSRPDGSRERDDQNRSVLGWIRPGTVFRFTLGVENLTDTELGALSWLLALPDRHFHRLGHGKPLGFGSVRLDLDPAGTDLRTGADWRTYYRDLAPAPDTRRPAGDGVRESFQDLTEKFEEHARTVTPDDPGSPLSAFLAAARGPHGLAVHYPRTRANGDKDDDAHAPPPDPEGRSYTWFVANDRAGKDGRSSAARSLPEWHTPGLPYSHNDAARPRKPRPRGGRR